MTYLKYLQIPYKIFSSDLNGCDCWGLVQLIYKNEHNINLPDFPNIENKNKLSIKLNEFITKYKKIDKPQHGAIIWIKGQAPYGEHCGYCISDKRFIHISKKGCFLSEIKDYEKEIKGFYLV